MTHEQKMQAQAAIRVSQMMLDKIASGQHEHAKNLFEQRQCADWQICYLLRNLIPTLPHDIRAQVQACYNLREQVWSTEHRAAQQKASPTSLQAMDSL